MLIMPRVIQLSAMNPQHKPRLMEVFPILPWENQLYSLLPLTEEFLHEQSITIPTGHGLEDRSPIPALFSPHTGRLISRQFTRSPTLKCGTVPTGAVLPAC